MKSFRWDLALAGLLGAALGAAAVMLWGIPAAREEWALAVHNGSVPGIVRMNTRSGDIEFCVPVSGSPPKFEGAFCWPVPAPPADGESPFMQLPAGSHD